MRARTQEHRLATTRLHTRASQTPRAESSDGQRRGPVVRPACDAEGRGSGPLICFARTPPGVGFRLLGVGGRVLVAGDALQRTPPAVVACCYEVFTPPWISPRQD